MGSGKWERGSRKWEGENGKRSLDRRMQENNKYKSRNCVGRKQERGKQESGNRKSGMRESGKSESGKAGRKYLFC